MHRPPAAALALALAFALAPFAAAYHEWRVPVEFHTFGVEYAPEPRRVEVHHYGNYTFGTCWGQPVWWGLGDGHLVVVRDGVATHDHVNLTGWGAYVTDLVIAFYPWGWNDDGTPWIEFENAGIWGPNAAVGHALLPDTWHDYEPVEVVTTGYAWWPLPDDLPEPVPVDC